MVHYYRFRSIDAILGDRAELKSQTIYFASPAELNDPMEGLTEFFWKGDRIVWSNLIRHYLLCLIHAFVTYHVIGETQEIGWEHIPWFSPTTMPDIPIASIASDLARDFALRTEVIRLAQDLANRNEGLSEEELHAYLRCIHPTAISVIGEAFTKRGLKVPGAGYGPRADYLSPLLDGLKAFFASNLGFETSREEAARDLFRASGHVFDQLDLINKLQNSLDEAKNFCFIYMDFPRKYLAQIKCLVYPNWYAACFSDSYQSASMWGHYADGHKGVCLQFGSKRVGEGDCLTLSAPVAANADGPQWMKQPFRFKKLGYQSARPKINFFTALGRLPAGVVRNFWYSESNGSMSCLDQSVFGAEDKWRGDYWATFERTITQKLPDWAYEKEFRLTFLSSINDLSPKSLRLLTYDFADLEGIIFGLRTSEEDKRKIIRLVCEKCSEVGRQQFNFFQASQESNPDRIESRPLNLIKFNSP